MGTGDKFINPSNKQVLGWDDISTNMIGYCRNSVRDTILAKWKVSGVMGVMNVVAAGANKLQVNTTERATDGDGHLMYPAGSEYGSGAFAFENTNASTYYVAIGYVAVPKDVRINPKTGAPQYSVWQEEIGYSAAPSMVSVVGGTLLEMLVDSVCEAGQSFQGRKVMVYKVVPAAGATTYATAVQICTVSYSSGHNYIQTSGTLGQTTTISQTSSDYVCVLLGPYVTKTNINPPPSNLKVATLAKVTGNGGTPTAIDTTIQRVLISYSTARAIEWEGYDWIDAGSVDSAIRTLVDKLKATTAGASGASRIGFDPTAFTDKSALNTNPFPGLGTIADGTYTVNSKLQDLLVNLDGIIQSIRSTTATVSFGLPTDCALNDVTSWNSGVFFARNTLGDSIYLTSFDNEMVPKFECERVSATHRGAHIVPGASGANNVHGHWSRFDFSYDSLHTDRYWNFWSQFASNIELSCCAFETGQIKFGLGAEPTRVRDCYFEQSDSHLTANASGAVVCNGTDSVPNPIGIFEGTIFIGPNTGTSLPHSCVSIPSITGASTSDWRPLVFRDCVFVCTNASVSAACVYISANYKVVFENCTFIGATGQTTPVIVVTRTARSHVVLKNCHIYAPSGQAIDWQGVGGEISGCYVISGVNSAVSQPQLISAYGYIAEPLVMQNNFVYISTSNIRVNGINGATNPVIEIGNRRRGSVASNNQITQIDGMYIKYIGGTSLHNSQTLLIHGNAGLPNHTVNHRNITVDLNSLGVSDSATAFDGVGVDAIVSISGAGSATTQKSLNVRGISLFNVGCGTAGVQATVSLISTKYANVYDLEIATNTSGTGHWYSFVIPGAESNLIGVRIHRSGGNPLNAESPIRYNGDGTNIEDLEMDLSSANFSLYDVTLPVIWIENNYCSLRKSKLIGYAPGYEGSLIYCTGIGCAIEGNEFRGVAGGANIQIQSDRMRFINNYIEWQSVTNAQNCVQLSGNHNVATGNIFHNLTSTLSYSINNTGTGNEVAHNIVTSV